MNSLIGRAAPRGALLVTDRPLKLWGILETGDGWWPNSLVEWLVENGLYIRATGDPSTAIPSESGILYLATDLSTDLSTHARAAEFQEVDEPVRLRTGQC